MELRVLLRLLASLHILPRLVSPAAPLPAPMVSVDPQLPVYVPGERLTLRCSAPQGEAVSSYQFYNQRGERVFSESAGPAGGPWLILTAAVGKAGEYSCEYWAVRDGQNVDSARSQPVRVSVMDRLLAPLISATAGGPWKDSVTVVCSLHGSYMPTTFQIFKNGHLVPSESTPESTHGARLQLHMSDPHSAGSYTCSYQVDVFGRTVESGLSSPLSIHLPAPPGAPTLSLHPSEPVYFPGETVTLLCLDPPGAHRAVGFQFSKDGGWRVLPGSSNTQALHLTGPRDSGSYTCSYWIQPSRWGLLSRESQSVSILVTEPPPLSIHQPAPLLAPTLALHPQLPAYLPGEKVSLTCSAPHGKAVVGFRFYQHRGDQTLAEMPAASGRARMELTVQVGNDGTYTCRSWGWEAGQEVVSRDSNSITVPVSAPPPSPFVRITRPSHHFRKGLPRLTTYTARGHPGEQPVHFYKGRAELSAADTVSEASTPEPRTTSANSSVLSPGKFTSAFKENTSRKWAPSSKGQAVMGSRNVQVSAPGISFPLTLKLAIGGSFFLINSLIFLLYHCWL